MCIHLYHTWSILQDRPLYPKTNLKPFKKIEIIPSVTSNHNRMKAKINNQRNLGKHTKAQKLSIMLLSMK
jgi:hypothetical protein